jgi:hypothetical protein
MIPSVEGYKGRVAIICGSAPTLRNEYEEIKSKRPDAVVIGINEAIWLIDCDILMTYHIEEVKHFLGKSKNPNIKVFTSKAPRPEIENLADGFFKVKGGATSAGDAIQMCLQLNFDEIILVGCPMNGGDGYFHGQAKENVEGCPRFGAKNNKAAQHKTRLQELTKELDFSKVTSMSGFTANLFGKPKL